MTAFFQNPRDRRCGFTLAELLVTIGIIAILGTIALTMFSNVLPTVRQETTGDSAALLNRAVQHYNQINSEITIAADSGTADELAVVALLQTRDPAVPGSPYLPAEVVVSSTSSTAVPRITWDGKFFTVIPTGGSGSGIAVRQ